MNIRLLYDLNKQELEEYLVSLGEAKYRAGQIYSALHKGLPFDKVNVSKDLKDKIARDFAVELPKVVNRVQSKDGTVKFLLELHDGNLIETVLLTQEYGSTVCVSSQVGCKMGCGFCASGKDGFVRNLSSGEILSQVLIACVPSGAAQSLGCNEGKSDKSKILTNVVIMGSGEPFDNFDNTVKFLDLVSNADGINIGARNISVSTAGLVPKIKQFADLGLQVNLCISLHAPNDEIRRSIMPVAKSYPMGELIDSAKYFFEKTKRRVIFEYSLIDGVNCAPEHAVQLSKLLKGFSNHVNLINLNKTEYSPMQPPTREVAMKFMDTLIKSGVSVTMRKSKGSDIDAACGQLKRRVVKDGK